MQRLYSPGCLQRQVSLQRTQPLSNLSPPADMVLTKSNHQVILMIGKVQNNIIALRSVYAGDLEHSARSL